MQLFSWVGEVGQSIRPLVHVWDNIMIKINDCKTLKSIARWYEFIQHRWNYMHITWCQATARVALNYIPFNLDTEHTPASRASVRLIEGTLKPNNSFSYLKPHLRFVKATPTMQCMTHFWSCTKNPVFGQTASLCFLIQSNASLSEHLPNCRFLLNLVPQLCVRKRRVVTCSGTWCRPPPMCTSGSGPSGNAPRGAIKSAMMCK